jgi:hypothetical protein
MLTYLRTLVFNLLLRHNMAITINAKTSGAGGLETTADNTGNINIQSGGSTVMSISSTGVSVTGSFSQDGAVYSTQPSFRNRIINGNMVIDQRNAGASVSTTPTDAIYTLDRWMAAFSTATRYTVQQNAGSVTPPTGFTNYLGVTSLAATSVGSSDYYFLQQIIEGFNVADLAWGTANAKTITLSFWVRSSLTGTFGGALTNGGQNRSYPFSYTISSANTWEQKTITIAGDTSGTWLTNNGAGIRLRIGLGIGSTFSGTAGSWSGSNFFSTTGATSVVGTSGATFYITGVQLEVGSTATDFEVLPYDVQLARCQRYCEVYSGNDVLLPAVGGWQGTTLANVTMSYKVIKRAAPTITFNGTTSNYQAVNEGVAWRAASAIASFRAYENTCELQITTSSGGTQGQSARFRLLGDAVIIISAEL